MALFAPIIAFGASTPPPINTAGLPGSSALSTESTTYNIIGNAIATLIQYVAVLAVLAVMYGGFTYILSIGDEEKIGKAKKIIIWALVGVFVSISAYGIVAVINNIRV